MCVCLLVCLLVFVCYSASSRKPVAKINKTVRISARMVARWFMLGIAVD